MKSDQQCAYGQRVKAAKWRNKSILKWQVAAPGSVAADIYHKMKKARNQKSRNFVLEKCYRQWRK